MGFPIFSPAAFYWPSLLFVLESSCGAAKEYSRVSFNNSDLLIANIYYIIYLYFTFRHRMVVLHAWFQISASSICFVWQIQ